MAMPAIALAVGQIAVYMRLLRSDMIATLQEDFITMAKAKGMSPRRVLWRHALRPSSLTLLTVAGLNVGTLIGSTVVVEVIFSLPGLGSLLFEAINARQYIAFQSLVAIIAIGYVLLNFLVDVLYAVLDPRIRHARPKVDVTADIGGAEPSSSRRSPPSSPSTWCGPTVASPHRRGPARAGWASGILSISWLVLIVALALLAPVLPSRTPTRSSPPSPASHRAPTATSWAATSSVATCSAV